MREQLNKGMGAGKGKNMYLISEGCLESIQLSMHLLSISHGWMYMTALRYHIHVCVNACTMHVYTMYICRYYVCMCVYTRYVCVYTRSVRMCVYTMYVYIYYVCVCILCIYVCIRV